MTTCCARIPGWPQPVSFSRYNTSRASATLFNSTRCLGNRRALFLLRTSSPLLTSCLPAARPPPLRLNPVSAHTVSHPQARLALSPVHPVVILPVPCYCPAHAHGHLPGQFRSFD